VGLWRHGKALGIAQIYRTTQAIRHLYVNNLGNELISIKFKLHLFILVNNQIINMIKIIRYLLIIVYCILHYIIILYTINSKLKI